jgi:hypothetical protein
MDCVVSFHLNPATCGVARFNILLARQLDLPVLGIFDSALPEFREPLVSVKIEEFSEELLEALSNRLDELFSHQAVRLFLHTYSSTAIEQEMLRRAAAVYCGNAEILGRISALRPDAVELWCPGMLNDETRFRPTELQVFTFGMAHKLRGDHFVKLHRLLNETGRSYALYLSTALHENTSFDESFNGAFEELKGLFGDQVYFLGFLSDLAVYNYIHDSTFFAAFFEKGVRANNTSVNAAMACGAVVITNLDAHSPPALQHGLNVLDIERLETLPTDRLGLEQLRSTARQTAQRELGWGPLVSRLKALEAGPAGVGAARQAVDWT